ncbi:MAG: hypothetical protein C0467_22935 [Planctomycetaceae bacterium]|nr:hypothetical protein [Planctomycetaceae bacterium]
MARLLLSAGFIVAVGVATGCVPTSVQSKSTAPSKADQARTQANSGSKGAPSAKAAPAQPPARTTPRVPYRSGAVPVVKLHAVSSLPYPAESDADEDALTVAADAIQQKLAELDPPVAYRPTTTEVRNEFVRRDTRTVRPPDAGERAELEQYKIDPNRLYVEYDVEVSGDQVRDLRTRDRVVDATRLVGVLTAVALVGFLFLRLDEWTGGYLTRWLAIGALVLASGAAIGLLLI